jgi:hypothetical protein
MATIENQNARSHTPQNRTLSSHIRQTTPRATYSAFSLLSTSAVKSRAKHYCRPLEVTRSRILNIQHLCSDLLSCTGRWTTVPPTQCHKRIRCIQELTRRSNLLHVGSSPLSPVRRPHTVSRIRRLSILGIRRARENICAVRPLWRSPRCCSRKCRRMTGRHTRVLAAAVRLAVIYADLWMRRHQRRGPVIVRERRA